MTDAEIVMLALRCLRDHPTAQQWAPFANAAIARRIPQRVCYPAKGGWQFSYKHEPYPNDGWQDPNVGGYG